MRISLVNKITIALVVFGLVPASIIAWFAYQANYEFRDKQEFLIKQAAIAVSEHVAATLTKSKTAGEDAVAGTLPGPVRDEIGMQVERTIGQYPFEAAEVYVVNPNNVVLVWRKLTGGSDPNPRNTSFKTRYGKII